VLVTFPTRVSLDRVLRTVVVETAPPLRVVVVVPVTALRDETVRVALRVELAVVAPALRETPAVAPRVWATDDPRELPATCRTSGERLALTDDERLLLALRLLTAIGDRMDEIPDARAYLLG
jgi:hypothetical protein